MRCAPWHPGPHIVYKLRDASGQILYIGRTVNLKTRLATHRRERPWFVEVTQVDTQSFDSFEVADAVERALIVEHQPKHNLAFTERYTDMLIKGYPYTRRAS